MLSIKDNVFFDFLLVEGIFMSLLESMFESACTRDLVLIVICLVQLCYDFVPTAESTRSIKSVVMVK